MGCAGSKEPKEPELNGNIASLDSINLAEKPGGSLQRKKSSQVGRASRRLTLPRTAPHEHRPAPLKPLHTPHDFVRSACTFPSDSIPTGIIPKRCRFGRSIGRSGAWA